MSAYVCEEAQKIITVKPNCARVFLTALRVWGVLAVCAVVFQPLAQEQFYTQSGGHGLQNAKTNARLSKVEGDVDVLNAEMAKVKPHAKAELGACVDSAEKLRYDGNNWICERETDPTVQPWAKKALPSCGNGSIIGVSGGELSCVKADYVSAETDPTVQVWAKSALPNCGTQQIITVQNGAFKCVDDSIGVTSEKDPHVYDFARNDKATLPSCAANELLTMSGGALHCQVDQVGITQEVDPKVQSFARNDVSGSTLNACGVGEVVRATTVDGKVVLACESAQSSLHGALGLADLSDVNTTGQVSGTVLMYSNGMWRALNELDPNVQPWAKQSLSACGAGQVLSYSGGVLQCVNDAGGSADPLHFSGLADVNVAGVTDGQFVKYDNTSSKWVPGTVQDFAQTTLPTCGSGQVLTGNGSVLSCTDDAGGSADPLDLVELADVRDGPGSNLVPVTNDFLRWNGTKWAAAHDKLSGTLTNDKWCYYNGTDVVCDRGGPMSCTTGNLLAWDPSASAFICTTATTALGLGTMSAQNADSVTITGGTMDGVTIGGTTAAAGTFTSVLAADGHITGNLRVDGNFSVSGSQTIDGVTFANGGIHSVGVISASAFAGDGSALTNIPATALRAAGLAGSIQFKGAGGEVSGTETMVWNAASRNLSVSGSVQIVGDGTEACAPGDYGKIRTVDMGGGDVRMQVCRP